MADLEIRDNVGQQALDVLQQIDQFTGNAVVEGMSPSVDTGLTISVASGYAIVNGSITQFSGGSVTLTAADASLPRKDVITIDSTGTLNVYDGVPEERIPETETLFDLQRPAPQDLGSVDETVIAEVFVAEGATSIDQATELRDRRLFAEITTSGVKILDDVSAPEDAVPKLYSDSQFTLHESNILLGSGESLTLDKFQIPAGLQIQVTGASVNSSDIELEIFDETAGETVYVTEGPVMDVGTPLYTGSEGNIVDIRVVNVASTSQDATCKITYSIV